VQQEYTHAELQTWRRVSGQLLQMVTRADGKGNVLVIEHPDCSIPFVPNLMRDGHSFGLAVHLKRGINPSSSAENRVMYCDTASLPLQDDMFRVVVLFLVTADGLEVEFKEAARVLAPHGDLLIVGVNKRSWAGLKAPGKGTIPKLHTSHVRQALHENDLMIDETVGSGLMGWSKPKMDWNHFSGLALPLADLLLIRARYKDRPMATRLRLKKHSVRAIPT
jgi:SAM-dependent methyltransferase